MKDWGEVSDIYGDIHKKGLNRDLENESEAQTRFDLIDRIIREILQWEHGQISVEPHTTGEKSGYIDYLLTAGDYKIIIEAKKIGAAFPTPTKRKKLKVDGTILGTGEIKEALSQAESYAKNKNADVVVVTNGSCWCFYTMKYKDRNELHATILFPFEDLQDAEELFNVFEVHNVEQGSLLNITSELEVVLNNKIINTLDNSDYRLGRNSIADHIMKGIDNAILSEALLSDEEVLKECYVESDSRTKFDSTLKIHLTQYKPSLIEPAKKIKRDQKKDGISDLIKLSKPNVSSPVTLIIGSVGSGKSTYLKHFELIKSKEILGSQKAHWIYIDYEKMGLSGNPRNFLYKSLNEYLLQENKDNPTDYTSVILPAYKKEIEALRRGPYSLLSEEKFNDKIAEIIDKDFQNVEPYVEKVFKYIASEQLCVIVIDNVDLYEDDTLETNVFSEAISISKTLKCVVFLSLRDSTFIKHKDSSIFNAYELKKFWINPPAFRDVLSKRLTYASRTLKDESAIIELHSGSKLNVSDLGLFFKIVQKSVLNEANSKLFEYLSDRNPRKGINLIQNFLTSGHIQADKAISDYIEGESKFAFPFHEVFKGSILGSWKYYREERSESLLNVFDSKLGTKKQQLILLYLLKYLQINARIDKSEVEYSEIVKFISNFGASEDIAISLLVKLQIFNVVHTNEKHLSNPKYFITLCGGYYISNLCKMFVYVETVMYDTNILDGELFNKLCEITYLIEDTRDWSERMVLRKERINLFFEYLKILESQLSKEVELKEYLIIDEIYKNVSDEVDAAIKRLEARTSRGNV
ncbi:hypothetical protein [Flavobacterium proteolyticum]|uniref:Uncharacterized protein n=1 Tax=Flavobacterium proteolyticum TaxID=2911683 RepID=A0ABR9WT04_9FLAO|nr:hypothetical protein [Flavobacterium proteolyticum]MBE9576854.1 hypothetical protein [Flavobacterium proteolyticum]